MADIPAAAQPERLGDCSSTARDDSATARAARGDKLLPQGPDSVYDRALRETIHGCKLSRAELIEGLLLDTDPGLKHQIVDTLTQLTDQEIQMQHGIRMFSHGLTPQCQPAAGGDDWGDLSDTEYEIRMTLHNDGLEERTEIFNEGLQECTKAGERFLKATVRGGVTAMRKMLSGDFGSADVRGASVFVAAGSSTAWLLNWHDGNGQSALLWSVLCLHHADLDPSSPKYQGDDWANEAQCYEVLKFMIDMGANINDEYAARGGGTVLHFAAVDGRMLAVKLLVDAGAAVDIRDKDKCTALMLASQEGKADIVQYLIDAVRHPLLVHCAPVPPAPLLTLLYMCQGSDANAAEKTGVTSLMMAAQKGSLDTVSALIAAGAVVNTQERAQGGGTALAMAANKGHASVASCLLKAGAKVDLLSNSGGTALQSSMHCANKRQRLETQRVLLRNVRQIQYAPFYTAAAK